MTLYFLVLDDAVLHQHITPPLAAAWRQRSFAPCQALCRQLLPAARSFAERYAVDGDEMLLGRAAETLSFDRSIWRTLAGEILLVAAAEVPEIPTAPDALRCLLAPEHYRAGPVERERFAPIEQVLFGTRDLVFGSGFYQPERAGLNNRGDVARLARYLAGIDAARWQAADLADLRDVTEAEDREEELGDVRQWFPALQDLYRRADEGGQVIVCEQLGEGEGT